MLSVLTKLVTLDPNGPTFVVDDYDDEGYQVKGIRGLEISGQKYDINFVYGQYGDSSELRTQYPGIAKFYINRDTTREAENAQNIIVAELRKLFDSGYYFSQVKDVDGGLHYDWSVLFRFREFPGRWTASWDDFGYQGIFRGAPIGGGNLCCSPATYVNFVSSTSVPEPLTIVGSLTAVGFGVALKRKFASVQKD